MVVVCIAALVRGAWEEKLLAAVYLGACMASLAVEQRPWTGPQGAVVAIDAVVLATALGIVLVSTKTWPILAAAFQVLTLGAHLAFVAAEGRLGPAGYLTVLALWSYGTVGCIAWGAALAAPIGLTLRTGPSPVPPSDAATDTHPQPPLSARGKGGPPAT